MTNHLARLPVELFITICELVHEEGEGPYLARLSRAFVPVGRRPAFRKVEVKKRAHLEQLCKVVEACPAVGACIVALRLVMPDEDGAVAGPTRVGLSSFFRHLVDVEALHIEDMAMAVGVVLEAADDQAPVLPNLVHLVLKGAPDGPVSLFDPSNYRHLDKYAQLRELELLAEDVVPASRSSSVPHAPPLLSQISSLSLYGNLRGDDAALRLLSSFTSVTRLALCDLSSADQQPDLSALLDAVSTPAMVQVLVLVQELPGRAVAAGSLDRFVGLKVVRIGLHAWTPALIPSFASLPHLETVGLMGCVGLSIADLQALLSNRDSLPHLQRILLDRAPGELEGELVDEDSLDLADLLWVGLTAHFLGIAVQGSLMEPVYAACDRFLVAREQEGSAAQDAAGAGVGAAAGAALEETSSSGTS